MTDPTTSPNAQPETSVFYDPEIDGAYTPNGGDK